MCVPAPPARRMAPRRALRRDARCAQVGARYRLPPEPAGQRPASLEEGEAAWRAAAAAAEADIGAGRCPSWARAPTLANCLMVAFQARPARGAACARGARQAGAHQTYPLEKKR